MALERGLAAELTDHLGFWRGESAPSARPNTRNGTMAKTVDLGGGALRDRWPPTGSGGLVHPALGVQGDSAGPGGLDSMIISLYARA